VVMQQPQSKTMGKPLRVWGLNRRPDWLAGKWLAGHTQLRRSNSNRAPHSLFDGCRGAPTPQAASSRLHGVTRGGGHLLQHSTAQGGSNAGVQKCG
jgi:hypothetical protein